MHTRTVTFPAPINKSLRLFLRQLISVRWIHTNFETACCEPKMKAGHESTFQKQLEKTWQKQKTLASFFLISQNTWICDMSSFCFLLCSYTISPIFKNKQENNLYILLLKYLQKEKQKEKKKQGLGLYRKKKKDMNIKQVGLISILHEGRFIFFKTKKTHTHT